MYVIDLEGEEYMLQADSENEGENSGNQSFSATIYNTQTNRLFIEDIAEMWRVVDHDDVEHKIIYAKRSGIGDSLKVEIKAVPLFFDTMDNLRIYKRYDEHMTAKKAFDRIFEDTGFGYNLVDNFDAVEWEGFGEGETKLETFKRALDRYKCEFRIVGNTINLEKQIGRDTQFMYRYRLNASNIEQEIDAEEMWTYARGYGDYGDGEGGDDWEDAELERDYTSPLADVLGKRHAPPIKNGNITTKKKMDEELKKLVDESLKISITADVYDLQEQGYPIAQSQLGDRVFVIDERIGLKEEVRVQEQTIKRNWKGEVIGLNITFGSENLSKRHQASIETATKEITDWINGRKTINYDFMDEAVKNASEIINGNENSIFSYSTQGVWGYNADDPNYVTRYVGDGIGFSKDGGATYTTAMTAEGGIVADVINTGTLKAITIDSVDIYGSYIEGSTFYTGSSKDYTEISGSKLTARGSFKRTWHGDTNKYDIRTVLENGYLRFRNDSEENSLYLSWDGFSTFVDGSGGGETSDNYASGTISWWDKTYSDNTGITISSHAGKPVMMSDLNHVVIHPKSEDSSKLFYFTKSQDGNEGYLIFSRLDGGTTSENKRGGFRFLNDKDGYVQVVNSDSETGSDTEMEAGQGTFNTVRQRKGTNYLKLYNENMFKLGEDSTGKRVASDVIRRRTYSSDANVRVTSSGTLGRSTSSEKYKVNIEKQFKNENEQLEHSKKILDISPVVWNDKYETETLCDEIEEDKKLSDDTFKIQKYFGTTSEKVIDVGLNELVDVGDDGELEGVSYSRMAIHLIPIIKDQQFRIEELEEQVNG